MRVLLIVFLSLFIKINADNFQNKNIIYLFKNHYYSYLCLNRWRYINKYVGKREDLLSIVAYACLKKHYLTYALDLAKNLRYTKEGRENSTYIISLFTIKNFLMRYIMDNFDISIIKIPNIESDDLGKIFLLTKKEKPKVNNNRYILKYKNENIEVSYNIKANEILIEYFKNNELVKKEKYW